MKKSNALEALDEFPNDFDLQLLIEKLVFVEKVKAGLVQLDAGKLNLTKW